MTYLVSKLDLQFMSLASWLNCLFGVVLPGFILKLAKITWLTKTLPIRNASPQASAAERTKALWIHLDRYTGPVCLNVLLVVFFYQNYLFKVVQTMCVFPEKKIVRN